VLLKSAVCTIHGFINTLFLGNVLPELVDLKEMGVNATNARDWISLAQHRYYWRAFV
jgi:hypothetical protein